MGAGEGQVVRRARGLLQLSPHALLRLANGNDYKRRTGRRPPSRLLRKWRRTGELDANC